MTIILASLDYMDVLSSETKSKIKRVKLKMVYDFF